MVYDSVTNLSDHLPLAIVFDCPISLSKDCCDKQPTVKRLRWDHADIPAMAITILLSYICSRFCQNYVSLN